MDMCESIVWHDFDWPELGDIAPFAPPPIPPPIPIAASRPLRPPPSCKYYPNQGTYTRLLANCLFLVEYLLEESEM